LKLISRGSTPLALAATAMTASIQLYENNPRHNDTAVDAVAASIREFGWRVPS
jgi:hypothetical protein